MARGDKSSTVTDASFYSESSKHALYALKVKLKKTARIRQRLHAFASFSKCTRSQIARFPLETGIITRVIRFWPYCPSKSFIPHYQQASHRLHFLYSFGHHWPQSLPLDYSGSIPEVKHALLITLWTKKCRNK